MSSEIQKKLKSYIDFLIEDGSEEMQEREKFLSMVPENMRKEIIIELNSKVLLDNLVLNANFSHTFLAALSYKIKERVSGPGETIFLESDHDDSIYFIARGKIEIFLEKNNRSLQILHANSHFGEIKFITGKERTASARSLNFSTLYYIERDSFLRILKRHPEEIESFCHISDKIYLYEDFNLLKVKCYACEHLGHPARFCPDLNFHPDSFQIFKQIEIIDKAFRKNFKRTGNRKENALMNIRNLAMICRKFVYTHRSAIEDYYSENPMENQRSDSNDFTQSLDFEFSRELDHDLTISEDHFIERNFSSDEEEELRLLEEQNKQEFKSDKQMQDSEPTQIELDKVKTFVRYFPHNNITNVIKRINELNLQKKLKEILTKKKTRRNSTGTISDLNHNQDLNSKKMPLSLQVLAKETVVQISRARSLNNLLI